MPDRGQLADLFPDGAGGRVLPGELPPGRIVRSDSGAPAGCPVLWLSDAPATLDLWARAYAERERSGLWPLLLAALPSGREFRPWGSGELSLDQVTPPGCHDPARLLAAWWEQYTGYDPDTDALDSPAERQAVTAPFGERWPGLAPAGPLAACDPGSVARRCAAEMLSWKQELRLGLVAAGRGADALAGAGWQGPLNYTGDTGQIAAVVRSWEDRFGATVVGAGFAELYLGIAAPLASQDEALAVAAEHFAFCPDNIWQGPGTLERYAAQLVGVTSWDFWWD
jgi:Domain of unknown function (DUF4253)